MSEKKIKSMFLIEPSLKERAEKKAKEEGLTYSAVIRKLLLDYVGGDQTLEDQIIEVKKELASIEEIKKELANIEMRLARLEFSRMPFWHSDDSKKINAKRNAFDNERLIYLLKGFAEGLPSGFDNEGYHFEVVKASGDSDR